MRPSQGVHLDVVGLRSIYAMLPRLAHLTWARRLPFGPAHARLDVSWITPDWAVGSAHPSHLLRRMVQAGIGSVLDLCTETSLDAGAFTSHGLRLLRIPVDDGAAPSEDQFVQGTSWLLNEVAAGRRVLICCRAGRGRSVTMACAVLLVMGYPLSQVLPLVARYRPVAHPTESQVAALQTFAARATTVGDSADSGLRTPAKARSDALVGPLYMRETRASTDPLLE